MKSFIQFFNEEYLALQSILYIDKTLYRRIISQDAQIIPSQADIDQAEQKLDKYDKLDDNSKEYLDSEEELALIRKYKENPNDSDGLEARNKVIEAKLKYIYAICHHLVRSGVINYNNFKDAVQYGVLGLVDAIEKFDESKAPAGFTPFARPYINGYIRNPFNANRSKDTLDGKGGEVASLDAEISGDRGEWSDKDQSLAEKVTDTDAHTPDYQLNKNDEQQLLKEFLRNLPEKEAEAIRLYYGVDGQESKTYQEIGEILGMTKMGARQLTERALHKLKEMAKQNGY